MKKKKRHSKLSKNEPVCMCKEGVCRIREGGLSGWGWGELSEIPQKWVKQKTGEGIKVLKKGGGT